ncbi:uracil-DNA glycosylase superfamily protein, partial [mine drainage metagenome]
LRKDIVKCRACMRLVEFRERIAKEKTKRFLEQDYWGKPVPGFGPPDARLVVIGLAPAAHGGNRTGRVFTGDLSAKFLMKGLYDAGFANQPSSDSIDDSLVLKDCYILAAVRCVPPDNIPTREEMQECFPFLRRELDLLANSR